MGTRVIMTDETQPANATRPPIDITTVDVGGAVVIITDRAGTILDVNEAFVRVTGYARTEALGATPRLLSSGLQNPDIYTDMWETVLAGRVWAGQLVDRYRDGRLRTNRVTITPIQGSDGRVSHLVAVQRDLAAHRTQPVVSSGIGELHTDQSGRCTYLDVEAAKLLDADMDQLYARGWEHRLAADDPAAIYDSIDAVQATGRHQRLDVRTRQGRWLHVQIATLSDQARGAIGTAWHLTDITGDIETHARLARRDAVITALLESIADPVAVVSNEGTVLATNPAWSRAGTADHPLLGSAPGDDLRQVLRTAAEHGDSRAEQLRSRVERKLQGLPTSAFPPGLTFRPLANEDGGFVLKLDAAELAQG